MNPSGPVDRDIGALSWVLAAGIANPQRGNRNSPDAYGFIHAAMQNPRETCPNQHMIQDKMLIDPTRDKCSHTPAQPPDRRGHAQAARYPARSCQDRAKDSISQPSTFRAETFSVPATPCSPGATPVPQRRESHRRLLGGDRCKGDRAASIGQIGHNLPQLLILLDEHHQMAVAMPSSKKPTTR